MAQAIVHRSCTKVRSAIGYEAATGYLKEMVEALEVIQPVLEDAERHSLWDEAAREWVRRVRNAAHGISDMVDEMQDKATPAAGTMTRSLARKKKNNIIVNKMKDMKQELKMLQESRRFASMPENIGVQQRIIPDLRVPDHVKKGTVFVQERSEEEMMVGRDEDKERILATLSSCSDSTKCPVILPIFGLGGIGTTSVARMVFNNAQFKEYTCRVWVHVSAGFHLGRVVSSIISEITGFKETIVSKLSGEGVNYGSPKKWMWMQELTKHLQQLLSGRKVVIVLDDLWEVSTNELEDLKELLGVGNKVIVIVTTCNEGIARKVCTVSGKPYKLNLLSDDMCWEIIKQTSNFEEFREEELEQIGRQIAAKCGGLPLAAQVLGGMLRYKEGTSWAEVMHTDIWKHWLIRNDNSEDENPLRILKLCYKRMPPNLRLCFAYCALLPKGHAIVKDDLVYRWIALDLIEPSDISSTTQLAKEYIRSLLDISFLQPTKSASAGALPIPLRSKKRKTECFFTDYPQGKKMQQTSGKNNSSSTLFTMHDIVHDLATCVMGDELLVLYGRMEEPYQHKYCRCAQLTNFDARPLKLSSILPSHLRALRLVGCNKMELSDDTFSFARFLHVLDLEDSSIQKLPESTCQLRHLGYLNLSGCSRLVALPDSFGNLVNLLSINLSRCYGLAKLPESLKKLKKLVYLDLSFWSCFEGIPVLGGLTNLEHLNLSHPCCSRAEHRSHLKGLKNVLGKLTKLQFLNLSMCLSPIFYYMSEEESLEYIRLCINGLSSLEHLDLSHNIFVFDLPASRPGDLNKLHTIDLSDCIRLKRVHRWMGELDCLTLENCQFLESYDLVVRADAAGYSSNLVQLADGNGEEVEITLRCLEEVKSREEVQRLRFVEKQKLRRLELCWTMNYHGYVEGNVLLRELEPPHALQCLELHGYNDEICLPVWWTWTICCNLSNLVEVTMEDFPRCRKLPPFGLLPTLKQVVLRRMPSITAVDAAGDLSGSNRAAFTLISKFTIEDMGSLKEFNTRYCGGDEEFMYRGIDELVINKCPVLSFGPRPLTVRRLVISNCDQVMDSSTGRKGGGHDDVVVPCTFVPLTIELVVECCKVPAGDTSLLGHLPSLQTLCFYNCDGMASLPQDLGGLSSLQELKIEHCNDLTSFPDSMQQLTSLQSMNCCYCESITQLPDRFGGLTSLKRLTIHGCDAIQSLPQSIQKLNNLKDSLYISDCPALEAWCRRTEDRELGDIQSVYGQHCCTTSKLKPKPKPSRKDMKTDWDEFIFSPPEDTSLSPSAPVNISASPPRPNPSWAANMSSVPPPPPPPLDTSSWHDLVRGGKSSSASLPPRPNLNMSRPTPPPPPALDVNLESSSWDYFFGPLKDTSLSPSAPVNVSASSPRVDSLLGNSEEGESEEDRDEDDIKSKASSPSGFVYVSLPPRADSNLGEEERDLRRGCL